ncbi:cell wall hydrolase [Salipaludibacillus daqingensis]|uniref:cell wall hydrolase n=1 Tax=Salipaludibacillus daqingensis TaxID=3041001 RepID=UPI0024733BE1|nr:cell wall hydrolase [Salipaludibacillus daqingensis]
MKKIVVISALAGMILFTSQEDASASTYQVNHGDSLWKIANKHNVTVSQLKEWNGLSGSLIYPGQTFKVGNSVSQVSTFTAEEKEVLARLVHAEAKGESYKGKVAVASVVLNRVRHNDFPTSVWGVIYETYSSGNVYAFEPVQNGEIRHYADADSVKAVEDAVNGYDPTNGAVYFFNPDTATSTWVNQLTISQRIGNHVFAK